MIPLDYDKYLVYLLNGIFKELIMIGKTIVSMSLVLVSVLFYAGCGSSSDTVETPVVVPTPTGSGFYIDSAVEGVQINCGGVETTTDALGSFDIVDGASCTFKLNDILLREQIGIKDGDSILEDNIQVAQFLQSLDNDNDPSNGITITAEVLEALQKDGVVTLPTTDEELAEIIARLQNAGIGFGGDFVSKEKAQKHIDETQKALEGVDTTNKAPKAVAPSDFTIEPKKVIRLDGRMSSDEDGEIVSYVWVELGNEGNPRNAAIAEFDSLSKGEHRFKLTVTDNDGASSSDEVTVTVKSDEISSSLITNSIVGKNLYKPGASGANALSMKTIRKRGLRAYDPSTTPSTMRAAVEEYGFSADGSSMTFKVYYADDGTAFVDEEYSYIIRDGYVDLTVITSRGEESFPVGTIIKLHVLDLTAEYVEVQEELIGAVDDIPAGPVKMYYDAATAAMVAGQL